jgi:hypothetical protein
MATIKAATSEQLLRVDSGGGGLDGDILTTNVTSAVHNGDVIQMAKIPKGTYINGLDLIADAINAGVTVSVGWAYVDGSAGGVAGEYIAAGTALATATRVSANAPIVPTVLTKDAYLIITIGGANFALSTNLTLLTRQKYIGPS